MTFSEKQGLKPFNWHKALFWAPLTTLFSTEHYDKLVKMSASWVTCAVGNTCSIIPRHAEDNLRNFKGCPKDRILEILGSDFNMLILNKKWGKASEVLWKIEDRSKQLIKELTA